MDTNIVIEAVRTNCWNAVSGYFTVETVAKCEEEVLTGDPLRPGYVKVDPGQLKKGISQAHKVGNLDLIKLSLALPSANAMDPGERELFAHALQRNDAWLASCADRAALRFAFDLGWKDRVVSLEALARQAGARPALKGHFTDRWLSEIRTAYLLDKGI